MTEPAKPFYNNPFLHPLSPNQFPAAKAHGRRSSLQRGRQRKTRDGGPWKHPLHAGRDPDPLRPRISRDSPISHEDSIHEDFKALYIHILYYRLISIKFIK